MKVMVEVEVEEIAEQILKQLAESGDVIQVVRCRDCKHGRMYKYTDKYVECNMLDYDPIDMDRDFFCAYGERKEK